MPAVVWDVTTIYVGMICQAPAVSEFSVEWGPPEDATLVIQTSLGLWIRRISQPFLYQPPSLSYHTPSQQHANGMVLYGVRDYLYRVNYWLARRELHAYRQTYLSYGGKEVVECRRARHDVTGHGVVIYGDFLFGDREAILAVPVCSRSVGLSSVAA